jgi:hypothetical protein
MIGVDYNVLNQRGSPSWFSDIYANIPTAGYKGRMFISTDTFAFYRDTGTGWDLIGGPGTGTITGSGTSGQISYFNGSSTLAGSNNLFWDITNSRLGIGTATPGVALDIHATGTNAQFNGTGTNNAYLVFQNAGTSKWRIGNTYNAGANSFDIYNNSLTTNAISISSTTNNITLTGNVTASTYLSSAGIFLSTGGQASSGGGYATINGGTNYLDFRPANGGIFLLSFPYSTARTFTFPDATGTIALTSNLSSYVPYTGATTSVNLGAFGITTSSLSVTNNSTFNSNLLIKKVGLAITTATYVTQFAASSGVGIGYSDGTGGANFTFPTASISTYTYPAANGTLALTSDLSSYLPLTGGTLTGQLYINPTNTATTGLDVASDNVRFRSDNLEGNKRQLLITMGSGTLIQFTAQGYGANYGTDLAFYTATTSGVNSSPAIYITSSNRVGIGTGSPADKFCVSNNNAEGIEFGFNSGSVYMFGYNRTTSAYIPITMQQSGGNVLIGTTTDTGYKLQVQGDFQIRGSGAISLIQARDLNGYYGFYSTTYASGFYLFSSAGIIGTFANGTGIYTPSSDINRKKDFELSTIGLDAILNLKPTMYRMIEENENINKHLGFIAQEVKDYIPQAFINNDDFIGLDYQAITSTIVKAIQELNEKLVRNNIN